jgi:hypothetical protein
MVDDKINNDIKMHLRCGKFWRPCGCAGAIQMASPNAACPGLLRKPLDAGIRQLLTLYCPSGRQGNRHTNNNQQTRAKMAILMAMAMCGYVTVHIAWWRRSRASQEATGRRHWVSIMPDNIVQTWPRCFFWCFHHQTVGKGHGLTLRTLFLIGVWHIKQKRRA